MTYSPFVVERFSGLNLVDDPQETGSQSAIDLLNVDLDRRGRIRSRDGYDNFTASAAATRLVDVRAIEFTNGTRQVLAASAAGTSSFYRAYDDAGATIATQALGLGVSAAYDVDFTRFGGPSAEVVYASGRDIDPVSGPGSPIPMYKWDGAVWTSVATMKIGGAGGDPYMLEVKASDNRMAGVFATDKYSRIGFSAPGDPETAWGANDYVDLTPGDGERITALVSWREMLFAFKETKFFVFGNTGTGSDGSAIFNYRPVDTGVGVVGRACATASPNGVFFLSRRGIYKTTGGDPVLVSRDIDPIFRGGASSLYAGGTLNTDYIARCQLTWHDERLYFAFPSGASTTNDRLLVFDPEVNQWLLWDVAANGLSSYVTSNESQLLFTYATGSNHIGTMSSAFTDDDGTAIVSRYQSAFYDLGAQGSQTYTRWTRLWGSGSPTVSVFTDYGTSDSSAGAVTLGTSPTVDEGYHKQAYEGQLFSHKLSATSAWAISRLQHDVAGVRP